MSSSGSMLGPRAALAETTALRTGVIGKLRHRT
jgi:hypothetical protein